MPEPDILSDYEHDYKGYQYIDRNYNNDSQYRQHPAHNSEVGGVAFEYLDIIFNVEYLCKALPDAGKYVAKALQHLGNECKEPFQKIVHISLRSNLLKH